MKNKNLISKENLIKQIAKKASISAEKAQKAYECVLNESPAFRKQSIKTVSVKDQVAIKVAGKQTVKKVQLKNSVAVVKNQTKVQKVEVIVEKIVEKPVEVIKKVEIIKEVPVMVVKEVIKEVKVVKEVPVEIIKEVTLVREVVNDKELNRLKKANDILASDLAKNKKELAAASKASQSGAKLEAAMKKNEAAWNSKIDAWKKKEAAWKKEQSKWKQEVSSLKKELAKKPKTVEVIKEVPVEIIKEVEVVKSIDMNMLKKMVGTLGTKQVSKKVVGETRNVKEGKVVSRKEVKPGSTKGKIISAKSSAGSGKKDDLTKIEGIGPKIAEHLHKGGIKTFKQLADAKVSKLQAILDAAGPRYRMHVPDSWPKQSKLAADGKWDALNKLQEELDGGK